MEKQWYLEVPESKQKTTLGGDKLTDCMGNEKKNIRLNNSFFLKWETK